MSEPLTLVYSALTDSASSESNLTARSVLPQIIEQDDFYGIFDAIQIDI